MNENMRKDKAGQPEILRRVTDEAESFLSRRDEGFARPRFPGKAFEKIPQKGIGTIAAIEKFKEEYAPYLLATTGPTFYGFVIGGVTPAALAGDWLTSLYDQPAFGEVGDMDWHIEEEAVDFVIDLLGLPCEFEGIFTSGATMATAGALAVAREWVARDQGKTADDGIYGLRPPAMCSGLAHASIHKALSIIGIGRNALQALPLIPGRESVDVAAVENFLSAHSREKCIVIANMGTSGGGDIDDLAAIAALKDKYDFFLHIDGAIGAVACASPQYRKLFEGIDRADSVTVDCHKWLNIPYDCAIALIKKEHRQLRYDLFAQATHISPSGIDSAENTDLISEGSRRFRALPVWFSLMAYGKEGYAEMVERDCRMARLFAELLTESGYIKQVTEVRLNGFAFTLNKESPSAEEMDRLKERIIDDGVTFLSRMKVLGVPSLRCSMCNWAVEEEDIKRTAESVIRCAAEFFK